MIEAATEEYGDLKSRVCSELKVHHGRWFGLTDDEVSAIAETVFLAIAKAGCQITRIEEGADGQAR